MNKRSKARKMRGNRTHGYGKTHRGAGNRGGRGNAGSGKRADCKKPSYWHKEKKKQKKKIKAINIKDVELRLKTWMAEGIAKFENGKAIVDLQKAGYGKLLNTGKNKTKNEIIVNVATTKQE